MWLLRGTQSAVFYYVSLSPCFEYNHKRKRRKEANRSQKERAELELSQPGLIHQPVPFQTNQFWAEEIQAGPGPPRGWRRHSLNDGAKRQESGKTKAKNQKKSVFSPAPQGAANYTTPPSLSSSEILPETGEAQPSRLSRGPSIAGAASTLDALKDTIRSTIARPDNWNWKRYEREDETLFGINDRISRMWDRATQHGRLLSADQGQPLAPDRRRPATTESEDHSWLYARNPGVNDLHPPTVSQLPRTKREVAWIMQPPPSRAVMEGKVRPGSESGTRRPLCRIGGVPVHPNRALSSAEAAEEDRPSTAKKQRPPQILFHPSGAEQTEAYAYQGEDANDADADEESDLPSSDQDYLSSRSSSPFPHHSASSPNRTPPTPPPLRRPPLAVLLDPQSSPKIQSYQLPLAPSEKLLSPRAGAPRPLSRQPTELDVWMGLVLPQMPERSRHSLPNVRLGEY